MIISIEFESSYTLASGNGSGTGIKIKKNNLDEYFSNRVKKRYYDIKGTDDLIKEFSDIVSTEFEIKNLKSVFSTFPTLKPWQIGEAFSECFLEDHKNARFPYPYSRDSKNPRTSLTGADLVGFFYYGDITLFLFGEVKTSSEKRFPPQVVTSRSGLKKQLEDIKSSSKVRRFLITWLGHKVKPLKDDDRDKEDYKKALKSYLAIEQQIKILGVLIRDTPSNEKDLESRFNQLISNLHPQMHLELLALYFPIKISDFSAKMGVK